MTFRAMWKTEAFPGAEAEDFETEEAAHRRACELIRAGIAAVKVWEIEGADA